MNFTAFGRASSQQNTSLKRRFEPLSTTPPNGNPVNGNDHAKTDGNGNGNGNGHRANGHTKTNGNGTGNGNGHSTPNGNGHANGHATVNGNGHATVNGNGHATVNGNGSAPLNGNGQANGKGNARRIPSLRTTLSSGVSIKGMVKFRSECEIDGDVEGTIESLGRLTVGKNGHVRGDIQSRSVTIHGTVDGNLSVGEKCELRSGCTLRGDIETDRLVVDENVNFTGNAAIATRDYLSELRPLNGNGNGQNHS